MAVLPVTADGAPLSDAMVRRWLTSPDVRGSANTASATLSVFIRGPVSRATLEAEGVEVGTSVPGLHTAALDVAALRRVLARRDVTSVRTAKALEPELDLSVPTTFVPMLRGAGPAFTGLSGAGVVVGIVDSGLDLDHGDFRDDAGNTRVLSLWDQTLAGTPPSGYAYGSEWSAAQINSGACPELDTDGHGTHVLGIAAGDGSQTGGALAPFTFAGMAPRARLIVVKTDYQATSIVDGVRYVFDRATALGLSAVVNLSVGTQFGPHDGTSDLEAAISALTGPGRIVVKSAGNDRGQPRHAEVFATPSGASITFFASGSVPGGVFVVDGWYAGSERLRVRVTTPNGTVIGPLAMGLENAPAPGQSTANGQVYLAQDSLVSGTKNAHLEVTIASGQNVTGTWSVTFLADALGPASGEVDLWRSGVSPGVAVLFQGGDQSSEELISEPGNAESVITVASWASRRDWISCNGVLTTQAATPSPGSLSAFSSPGPTRDGRAKPEIAAPGENILSATSFDTSPVCPSPPQGSSYAADAGQHVANRGTSMSAPHVTGAVALLLQKRGALTPAQVASYLVAEAIVDGVTGAVWNKDWGAGRLRLGDLVDPTVTVLGPNGGESMVVGGLATLSWSASDSLGSVTDVDVELSRNGSGGPFETIAAAVANTGSYAWTVSGPATAANQAFLRVRARDDHDNAASDLSDFGFTVYSAVDTSAPPPSYSLTPPAPNPAAGPLTLELTLAARGRVRLDVLDLQGRTIAVLIDGERPGGTQRVLWNGRSALGPASSGLYFVRCATAGGTFIRRIAVAR